MNRKTIVKLFLPVLIGVFSLSFMVSSSYRTSATSLYSSNSDIKAPESEDVYVKYQDFIHVVGNRYVIDDELVNNTDKDVVQLREYIDFVNSIIDKYNVKDVSLEDGFTVYIDDSIDNVLSDEDYDLPLDSQRMGVNKIRFYSGGFYLYLDSYWTSLAVNIGVGAITGTISYLLSSSGIGAAIASQVASSIANHVVSNSSYVQRGCVVKFGLSRIIEGIWPQ